MIIQLQIFAFSENHRGRLDFGGLAIRSVWLFTSPSATLGFSLYVARRWPVQTLKQKDLFALSSAGLPVSPDALAPRWLSPKLGCV